MFDFLLDHDYFKGKEFFDNSDQERYKFDEKGYFVYTFEDEENHKLILYVPEEKGDLQWTYYLNEHRFIQKLNGHLYDNEEWYGLIIEMAEMRMEIINKSYQ